MALLTGLEAVLEAYTTAGAPLCWDCQDLPILARS